MARANRTRYTVLGTLTYGPMSGYDIKKFIERSINNFWRESYGQIYPTLKSLSSEGLVTRTVEKQEGKPDRFVYSITEAGRDELREWLVEPAEPDVPRSEFLLKIFFGSEISLEANLRHIERYSAEVTDAAELCRTVYQQLTTQRADDPRLPYWSLVLRNGIAALSALEEWCREAPHMLQPDKKRTVGQRSTRSRPGRRFQKKPSP